MEREPAVDAMVEQAGRWAAARSTRRSFLGKVGRVAMLVAAGPVVADLLTAQGAEARVCGQSGVSPLCPTFDCNDVWGWCWYAQGCCSDGGLKKICDCCAVNWPNVHGYCPSGTNVRCVVESCAADPRLMTVVLKRFVSDSVTSVAASVRADRFANGAPVAVLADSASTLFTAVAMPVGAVMGAAVFPVARAALATSVIDELRARGTVQVKVVGSLLPLTIDAALADAGFDVERVGLSPEVGPFSEQVANWVRAVNGVGQTVCVEYGGVSAAAAPVAAAFGSLGGMPLVVGAGNAARVGTPTYLVGPEAAAGLGAVPSGSTAYGSGDVLTLSVQLADLALGLGLVGASGRIVLAPRGSPAAVAAAGLGGPVVLHEAGSLAGARDWLYRRQATYGKPSRAYAVGASGGLGDPGIKELQSIVNGFATERLIGVGGQGLPVIPQPPEERCIGCARVSGVPTAVTPAGADATSYWTSRAPD